MKSVTNLLEYACKYDRIGVSSLRGAESFLSSNWAQIKATRT